MIDHNDIPLTPDGMPDIRRTPEHLMNEAFSIRQTIARFGPAAPSLPASLRARIADTKAATAAAAAAAASAAAHTPPPPPAPAPEPRAIPDLRRASLAELEAAQREILGGSSGSSIGLEGAAQGAANVAAGNRSSGGRFSGIW